MNEPISVHRLSVACNPLLAFFLSHGSPGGGRCMRPPLLFFTNYVVYAKKIDTLYGIN